MLTSLENSIKYHALSPAVPYLGGGKDALRKKCRVFVLPFLENFANNTMQPIKRILNATSMGFVFLVSLYIWVFPCLTEIFVKLKSTQIYVGMCKNVQGLLP